MLRGGQSRKLGLCGIHAVIIDLTFCKSSGSFHHKVLAFNSSVLHRSPTGRRGAEFFVFKNKTFPASPRLCVEIQ
jgi:hypothetical protein